VPWFDKDWFRHSEVGKEDSQTHRQHSDLVSLVLLFQSKEIRLKNSFSAGRLKITHITAKEIQENVLLTLLNDLYTSL
jgi:hypothetical protein